jgi:hypothetical protein
MEAENDMIDEETIRKINEAFAGIPLSRVRVRELPIEVNQFIAVAERVRAALIFEAEPSAFVLALESLAWSE